LGQIDAKSLLCIILSLLAVTMILCPTYSFSTGRPGYYGETGKNNSNNQLYIQREIVGKDLVGGTSKSNDINKTIPTSIENQTVPNLIANSGFSIVDNKSGLPLYWNDPFNICGKTYTCKINGTDGWDDYLSFQVSTTNNTNNTWSFIRGREVDVKPGEYFHIVSHLKLNNWTTQSHIAFEGFNETSKQWYQIIQCPVGLNGTRENWEWREFRCFITIPDNTTELRPVLNAGWSSQPNKEATTWFDSVSMIKNASFVTDPNLKIEALYQGLEHPNFVSNSDFSRVNNKSGLPLYWDDPFKICRRAYTCKINGTDGWDDKLSFQISTTNNTNNTWSSIKGREIDVKPGEQLQLVSHLKLNKWATQSHVAFEGFNETSKQWYQIIQCPVGLNGTRENWEWREFRCFITIPDNTTKIRPVLNAGWSSQPNKAGTTWFDSVSMIKNASFVTEPNLKIEALYQGLEYPNFVSNSDFSRVNNKSGLPLYWNDSLNICGMTYTCKINVTDGWDDYLSFQISTTNNTNNTWSFIRGREIDVKSGQTYQFVIHIKLNKWATQSHIAFEGFNETSKQWYQFIQCPSGLNGPWEWREFRCFITIPDNTTELRPVLNAGWSSQPNKAGTTWFDSVSMIKNASFVTDPNLKIEALYQGLEHPIGMAFLGQDDILVLEKDKGTVRRIVNGTLLSKPLLDVPVANKNERGMLGIAIARHEPDHRIYVFLFYTASATGRDGDDITLNKEPLGNRLYRYEYINGKLTNPKLFLDLPTLPGPIHNGGVLRIGHDKQSVYLLIGNVETTTKTQNNMTGKEPDGAGGILRLTLDGKPMQSVLGNTYPLNLYYAYGIRNSFGMDFDPLTGNLWDTENGPSFGDEINLVEPGFNSGWRKVQGIWKALSKDSQGPAGLASEKPDNLVDFEGKGKYSSPEFTWNHTVGPTDLKFIATDKLGKQYENDMFVADVNNGRIYHFELNQNRTALLLQGPLTDKVADRDKELNNVILAGGLGRITDLQTGPDGYLYIVVFDGGKIYRIVPK
jgi:aldose sugar dehydrogenase